MQNEAVEISVHNLREQAQSEIGGLPKGEARGRIILPCGTGKTRISLKIIESLTPLGELSIVLCPSIALVAQIRREYLQNSSTMLDMLAVCSDATAGYDPKKEGTRNSTLDPTVDNSNFSASEIKGKVTTDAEEISGWMRQNFGGIKVLIGTYQSSAKVSEALLNTGARACVMIADEAHRTAGLKRKNSKSANASKEEKRLRDFTACHDNQKFPVTYRIYQTATPRIYDVKRPTGNQDWMVRSMDDETTFGVELYRKSYLEAVRNRWLSDYRIIAMGIADHDAFETANALARETKSTGRGQLTTTDYLRGLAFALTMGGATQGRDVDIKSCIAFMNTVDKSKNMAKDLQTDKVKEWVASWLGENADGRAASNYSIEHLDASSNALARETAKGRLAAADTSSPHGIINVGIFGEGTDSPSLSAVAFLEARKSPIDVVQAVGRAMRTAPGKKLGYIICPILIPPSADPEKWLSNSDANEGWQELGQILLALRAHDKRIEDSLEDLLHLYIPDPPPVERTLVAVAAREDMRITYGEIAGLSGAAQEAVEQILEGKTSKTSLSPICGIDKSNTEITQVLTGKRNEDGTFELRSDSVIRDTPKAGEVRGVVNIQKTKAKARKMINTGEGGIRLPKGGHRTPRKTARDRAEEQGQTMLKLSGLEDYGSAIKMNLLSKSGLSGNRVMRDLNILEGGINEASHHLRADELLSVLNRHFGLDRLKETNQQADGCTIASLLMMNAAMLHQRIANGGWLQSVSDLSKLKSAVEVVQKLSREWERIMRHDFRPVLEPALESIYAIQETGKIAGLQRALHHLATEAERIAETYADMGADHAGPLFNRVMGNQASDGAFFTKPVAASLAARLTLDICGNQDWSDPEVWHSHKTVDLACGSGTLLAAVLSEKKRRAAESGANIETLTSLQKIAVENTIKGLDINPVSLQLAASQLTAGNQKVSYRKMGLHLMPYGPDKDAPDRVHAGTLELLGQRAVVQGSSQSDLVGDDTIGSQATWQEVSDAELENAVDAVKNTHIVIMNPPFTNRSKMGEKFPPETQRALRNRADLMERELTKFDPDLMDFVDRNSIRPLFVALADHCIDRSNGILAMINPTIALTAPSGQGERLALAERFHIHTVLTSHQPKKINLSQHTAINESIVVMRRHIGDKPSTRFINLDKLPVDESEVADFHRCLLSCDQGLIKNGWGEVSYWPADRIEKGDWTPAIWRSPILAEAATKFANHPDLKSMRDELGLSVAATGQVLRGNFEPSEPGVLGSFPILKSKSGTTGQTSIQSRPDEYWIPKMRHADERQGDDGIFSEADRILEKAGYLLITAGQRSNTACVTATASHKKYVGNGWMPVTGLSLDEAKATAVFINSTAGRVQLMRNLGRTITFPTYSAAEASNLRIPNIKCSRIREILASCWERTKDMEVPQFQHGECEVRRFWDESVAEAMGWNVAELAQLRLLLHKEPHVRGLGYGQYAD